MIKQVISIEDKWVVKVYYIISNNDYNYLKNELQKENCPELEIQSIYSNMLSGMVMGFTFNNLDNKVSIVGVNKHKSKSEYISTIVHEAEHVKEGILDYYGVRNIGESPAYTIGYIVKRMYEVFKYFICG